VTELLNRVKELVNQASHFMSVLLACIVLATLLLLYTIQSAQGRVRTSEDVILRVIGATETQLVHSFLVEVLILSAISAGTAYTICYWICEYLSTAVFEFETHLPLYYLFISFIVAFGIQCLSGIPSILKIQAQAPQLSMAE
jgi:predicted lysophospholipase L1 biosynthesis ABC-type transport system permease subunit